jgi:hypothetical protein
MNIGWQDLPAMIREAYGESPPGERSGAKKGRKPACRKRSGGRNGYMS